MLVKATVGKETTVRLTKPEDRILEKAEALLAAIAEHAPTAMVRCACDAAILLKDLRVALGSKTCDGQKTFPVMQDDAEAAEEEAGLR